MNLRVDLILQTEQRSASVISVKSILRISIIIVPVILLLVFASSFLSNSKLVRDLHKLEVEWRSVEPQRADALRLLDAFKVNSDIKKELDGFKNSNISWNKQLTGLMREAPREIQIQKLRITHTLQLVDDIPARTFVLTLNGKAVGPKAADNVQLLLDRINRSESFELAVENAIIPEGSFTAVSTGTTVHEYDRNFQIDCKYKPRKLE